MIEESIVVLGPFEAWRELAMSSINKQHVKELKRPDAIQLKLTQTLNWILENIRYVAFGLVPILIGIGGYYGFRYFQDRGKDARLTELGKVQIVYENEQRKAGDARQAINAKIEALEAKATPKTSDATKSVDAEKSKSPAIAAEQEALRKDLSAIRADHSESLGQYLTFSKKYQGDAEGWLAGLMAAQILAEDNKVADARSTLEAVVEKAKDQAFYQIQGRLFLSGLMEEAGEYDQALSQLEVLDKSLEKLGAQDFKSKVLLARGRVLLLKNDKEEAKKTFGTLVELHAGSPEAQKARAYQTFLN